MEESNNNTGKLIGALVVGAAIGAILGILFAPDKGSETRNKLSKKGGELTDAMKEKISHYLDVFKKESSEVKDKVIESMENGKAKFEKTTA